jgi:hypothetical protein
MPAAEEVLRILAHADPASPEDDAYVIVTFTRPRGSTEQWKVFRAYGPIDLTTATTFLNTLGHRDIQVIKRSDKPFINDILNNLPIVSKRRN